MGCLGFYVPKTTWLTPNLSCFALVLSIQSMKTNNLATSNMNTKSWPNWTGKFIRFLNFKKNTFVLIDKHLSQNVFLKFIIYNMITYIILYNMINKYKHKKIDFKLLYVTICDTPRTLRLYG